MKRELRDDVISGLVVFLPLPGMFVISMYSSFRILQKAKKWGTTHEETRTLTPILLRDLLRLLWEDTSIV